MMTVLNNNANKGGVVSPVSVGLKVHYDPSDSLSYPGTGSSIYDLSGNGQTGTVVGNPTDSGNFFTFTGSQYIQTPNIISLWTGKQHSIEIWVKPSALGAGFTETGTNAINTGYHGTGLEFYNVGPFVICNTMLFVNGTGLVRAGGGTTPLNAWYQIVRTYDGTNAIAYVNKTASSATAINWTQPSPGWYINFGANDGTYFANGNAFQGSYGVIRIYNKVLTLTEVTQNYNATKSKYGL